MTIEHAPAFAWRLLDLVVIGAVGVLLGLLLAAVVARDHIPDPPVPKE